MFKFYCSNRSKNLYPKIKVQRSKAKKEPAAVKALVRNQRRSIKTQTQKMKYNLVTS